MYINIYFQIWLLGNEVKTLKSHIFLDKFESNDFRLYTPIFDYGGYDYDIGTGFLTKKNRQSKSTD